MKILIQETSGIKIEDINMDRPIVNYIAEIIKRVKRDQKPVIYLEPKNIDGKIVYG